jgi:2-oxoglutarate dehydrogenase E2 component (dihydrolipoamide succinyltransferase)
MSATLDIRAPADQTEGTRSQVLRWLKAVGDSVSEHEPLIEIETDKVTVEVAAPASGVLREIVKGEQEEIEPGEVLGRLEMERTTTGDRESGLTDAGPVHDGAVSSGAAQPARPSSQSSQSTTAVSHASSAASSGAAQLAPLTPPPQKSPPNAGAHAPTEPPPITPGNLQRLSPALRRLISERSLDPAVIVGTGEGGRITIDDVVAHSASAIATPPSTTVATASASADSSATTTKPPRPASAAQPSTSSGPTHSIPHTTIRKRIADHMVQSLLKTAPHVTTVFEADLTAVLAHRAHHRASFDQRGAPLTLTAYFLTATAVALRAVPEANSRWTDSALEIFDNLNIGVATAIEGTGLVVPVLHNVESLDLFGIAQRLNELVTAARDGKLEPADVRGGTFTISNHGVSGSLLATPIVINQPQSAILGIGKMEKRAVVVGEGEEERLVIRPKCYVTLTIDHRVMDGHQANHFLQVFVRTLEASPAS